jgi:hypothetical protein
VLILRIKYAAIEQKVNCANNLSSHMRKVVPSEPQIPNLQAAKSNQIWKYCVEAEISLKAEQSSELERATIVPTEPGQSCKIWTELVLLSK